ncbi:MAG: thiamine diphosphokinase [Candidatus Zixiibacteriota bacterium]
MRDYIIFTHGVYKTAHLRFYRKLCRSRFKIAVDGGIRFFLKTNISPNLLIGDLDSFKRVHVDLVRQTKVLTFPVQKDKTDLQLAFEYCLKEQAESIDIVLPSFGQPDHFLGNVMLVHLINQRVKASSQPRIRFVNITHEIILVQDSSETFVNCISDIVSVVPLSKFILLTCVGTEYDVRDAKIRRGQTWALRNRIRSRRATFDVKGRAFVIHRFSY